MKTEPEKEREKSATIIQEIRSREPAEYKPAQASKYLHRLSDYHKQHPDMQAIIYLRESARTQDYNDNGKSHEKVLRRRLKKLNVPIAGYFYEVSSGWVLDSYKRQALKKAMALAKKHIKNGRETVIITTSPDRFLRHRTFHSVRNPDALPTEAEFEEFVTLTGNVPLLTMLHPDMPPRKVRGYQTRWGQEAKGNSGGRPVKNKPGYKRQRQQEKQPCVLRLRRKGASWGDIFALTGIPKSTAADWVRIHS